MIRILALPALVAESPSAAFSQEKPDTIAAERMILSANDSIRSGAQTDATAAERMILSANDSIGNGAHPDSIAGGNVAPAPAGISAGVLRPVSTPVDIDREKPDQPYLHYYDKHGNALETPVRFLSELDTVTNIKVGPAYPLYNGMSVGVNVFDGFMMLFGQQRASFDISVNCSLHNWFFPTAELGIGFSDAHPDDGRFNFKVPPSFYGKIGLDYNFIYKSNPAYRFFFGLRAGFTKFKYDIYGIQAGSQYYYSDRGPKEMTGLDGTAIYGQVLVGLNVKIYKRLYLGWTLRYSFNLSTKWSDLKYPAWFIPGKGAGPLLATFLINFQI